jgi:hypothetical protein
MSNISLFYVYITKYNDLFTCALGSAESLTTDHYFSLRNYNSVEFNIDAVEYIWKLPVSMKNVNEQRDQ